jgi:proline iminopeptidase
MSEDLLGSGHLEVGDGHTLYWEEWGAADGVPVVCLHGGPGAGFNDSHKALFDVTRHRVLFFDQRGCGRSTPSGRLEHNTSAALVADIVTLMDHRGWDTAHVAGGSWGSTLALLFAIAHPERVRSLLLWSVYLMRERDDAWVTLGGPRTHFPAEWETFVGPVPAGLRSRGKDITHWYAERMRSADPDEALRHARAWVTWELTLCSVTYDPSALARVVEADSNTVNCALIETHFLGNSGFIPENHILDSIGRIQHLPCRVVQGRWDMCTPPYEAHDLASAYGENLKLLIVNAGHLRTEPELMTGLRAAAGALT